MMRVVVFNDRFNLVYNRTWGTFDNSSCFQIFRGTKYAFPRAATHGLNRGEVLSIGEKPTIAVQNPAGSLRMALAETLMNLVSVPIERIDLVRLSANWMASCGELEDDYSLRLGVEAISEMCVELGIAIPVGKDSLSMKTRWEEGNKNYEVKSPLSGVISGVAPVPDVTKAITTELNTLGSKNLYHLTISDDRRLGGSILEEVTNSLFTETPDINNIQTLKDLFKKKKLFKKIEFKVSNESAWEVGLACGGEIAVFLEQIN